MQEKMKHFSNFWCLRCRKHTDDIDLLPINFWNQSVPNKHFNVVSTLYIGWYDVATSHNVESTLSISTMIWTTSDNVETTLSFLTSIFTSWAPSKQRCEYDHMKKTNKPWGKHKIILLSFKEKLFNLNKMDLKLSSLYSPFWQEYVEEYLQSRKNS